MQVKHTENLSPEEIANQSGNEAALTQDSLNDCFVLIKEEIISGHYYSDTC